MKTIDKNTLMMKAVKKTDRELELSNFVGFKAVTRIHASKKKYNRKKYQKNSNFFENND
jgi:hypothetical protein